MVMLPLAPWRRRRADQLAAALDGRERPLDPQVAALAALAGSLRRLPAGPAPEFRDQLRRRLVAVAAVSAPAAAPVAAPARPRPVTAPAAGRWRMATAAVAAVTLLAGVSVGATTSLPGSPLYGLKRTAERVQLAVAGSDYARGVRELQFAASRLSEVADLAGRHALATGPGPALPGTASLGYLATAAPATARIADALATMDDETAKGAQYLARDYEARHRAEALTTLHAFSVRQYDRLQALLPALSRPAADRAEQSIARLDLIDRVIYPILRQDGLCGPTDCPPPLPGAAAGAPATGTRAPSGTGSLPGAAPSMPATGGSGSGAGSGGAAAPQPAPGSTGGLGGLLGGVLGDGPSGGGSGSAGSGSPAPLPVPIPSLPVPVPSVSLPVPVPTLTVPLPSLPGVTLTPSPTPTPGSSGLTSTPAPGVTACLPPLILVGGICVTVPALP
ncbi:MAG: DUF5667 domain-containing protein [Frankiaceae bacterium]